jgi:hypothetical protein
MNELVRYKQLVLNSRLNISDALIGDRLANHRRGEIHISHHTNVKSSLKNNHSNPKLHPSIKVRVKGEDTNQAIRNRTQHFLNKVAPC